MRSGALLCLLILFAPMVHLLEPMRPLSDDPGTASNVGTLDRITFQDGTMTASGTLTSPNGVLLAAQPGFDLRHGTVDLELANTPEQMQRNLSFIGGGLTGTFANTSVGTSGLELVSTQGGPPTAGNGTQHLFGPTTWNGVHRYDTVRLSCGIASCGSITTGANLTIIARTVIIEVGTFISASETISGGIGAGTGTSTPSNGRSDGAGGGGHLGAGGSGGGTNGGAGGSTYGTGVEHGSAGGSVTGNANYANANGGEGGGSIRIESGSIIVNGSILSEGGDGDSGPNPSGGTGAGGSGAGGGSGGSIQLKANTIEIGPNGVISADGGSGGDGQNGAQSGIGIGMYDGGDGGGGGGGGGVTLSTTSGGLTNQGTVHADAGAGGTKGFRYGTGIDGVDGTTGNAGTVTTSTWPGYQTGGTRADLGVFISDPIDLGGPIEEGWMNTTLQTPTNTTVILAYRGSMSTTGSTSPVWGPWTEVGPSVTLPRIVHLQVSHTLSRTNTTSPTVEGVELEGHLHAPLTGLTMTLDGRSVGLNRSTSLLTTAAAVDAVAGTLTLEVPLDAVPSGDAHVGLTWTQASGRLNVSSADLGQLASFDLATTAGFDLRLTDAEVGDLLANASEGIGIGGLPVHRIVLDLNSTSDLTGLGLTTHHVTVPWSIGFEVDLEPAIDAWVQQACGNSYLSTRCVALSDAPVRLTAASTSVSDRTSWSLTDLNLTWVDDEPPRLDEVTHRFGGLDQPTVRFGDRTGLVVTDLIGEEDAIVRMSVQGSMLSAVNLTWSPLAGSWSTVVDTRQFLNGSGTLIFDVELEDRHGNLAQHIDAYRLDVQPPMPQVAAVTLQPGVGTQAVLNGTAWEGDPVSVAFEVEEANGRSDLEASLSLTSDDSTPLVQTVPLSWDPQRSAYHAVWTSTRADLGTWQVETILREPGQGTGIDADGLQPGPDVVMRLVDLTAPGSVSVDVPTQVVIGHPIHANVTWTAATEEAVSGTLTLLHDGDPVDRRIIDPTLDRSITLTFPTVARSPGDHILRLDLTDDAGNAVTTLERGVRIAEEPFTGDLSLALGGDGLDLHWNLTTDDGAGTLEVVMGEVRLHQRALENGSGHHRIPIEALLTNTTEGTAALEARLCHVRTEVCERSNLSLDLNPWTEVNVSGTCPDQVVDPSEAVLARCRVTNDGPRPITLRWTTQAGELNGTWERTIAVGDSEELRLENPAATLSDGGVDTSLDLQWHLTARHAFAGPVDLLRGTHTGLETNDSSETTTDSDASRDTVASGDRSPTTVPLLVGGAALLLGAAGLLLRSRKPDDGFDEAFEVVEHPVATPSVAEAPISTEPTGSPEAIAYHEDLIAQGYTREDAIHWTRQHFPEFHP